MISFQRELYLTIIFELNSIYCVDVGISEEEPEYSNGEFNFCLSCTQSRSFFIDLCYNTLISDNTFTKDATGATSTEINGVPKM